MEFKQELEIRVVLTNLINVVRVRLLGINDAIRSLRKRKPRDKDELSFKELALKQLVDFRKETNTILNKLSLLQGKEELHASQILSLKKEFMELTMNTDKDNENNTGSRTI